MPQLSTVADAVIGFGCYVETVSNDKSKDIITRRKKKSNGKGCEQNTLTQKLWAEISTFWLHWRCGQGWLTGKHKCAHNGHRMLPSSFLQSRYCLICYSPLTRARHIRVRILLCRLQRVTLCVLLSPVIYSLSHTHEHPAVGTFIRNLGQSCDTH